MNISESERAFVTFTVDGHQCGIPLSQTLRIVLAAAITTLPGAPAIVKGQINIQGSIMPVISLRRLLCIPDPGPELTDRYQIAGTEPGGAT
jgi:purine-binding chemotaxis protein CheW